MSTVNGVHALLALALALGAMFAIGLRGAWRAEFKRIREAHQPITPPVDYERLHYGPALKAFLDKQASRS